MYGRQPIAASCAVGSLSQPRVQPRVQPTVHALRSAALHWAAPPRLRRLREAPMLGRGCLAGAAWPGLPPGAESHIISWVPRRGCGGALAPAPRRRCDRLWLCRPGCVRSSTRYTRRAARKRRRRSGPPSVAPPRLRALGGPQLSRQRRIRGSAKSYCRSGGGDIVWQ